MKLKVCGSQSSMPYDGKFSGVLKSQTRPLELIFAVLNFVTTTVRGVVRMING